MKFLIVILFLFLSFALFANHLCLALVTKVLGKIKTQVKEVLHFKMMSINGKYLFSKKETIKTIRHSIKINEKKHSGIVHFT